VRPVVVYDGQLQVSIEGRAQCGAGVRRIDSDHSGVCTAAL
jgi:hypothetical protein